jgi:hypothetical protein
MDRRPMLSEFDPKEEKEISRLANRLRELINLQKEIEVSPYHADNSAGMRELTAKKAAIDDRLDSSIDKTIKRLALIKTFKPYSGKTSESTRSS